MHDRSQTNGDDESLAGAVLVNVLLTVALAIGGLVSGSISLLAVALFKLNRVFSADIQLVTERSIDEFESADEPRHGRRTVLAELANLISFAVAAYLVYEGVVRYSDPTPVAGWTVVLVAEAVFVVDVVRAIPKYFDVNAPRSERDAVVRNVPHLLALLAAVIAGFYSTLSKQSPADAVATLLVAGYLVFRGGRVLPSTTRKLIERIQAKHG